MLYIKKTFSYLKKSFWLLALLALPAAALMGLFLRPLSFITFIPQYVRLGADSFADIAWFIFAKFAVTNVYPLILIFILLTLTCALSLSIVEKHFRVGKLMLKAPLQDINSSLFPTLKTLGVMTAVYLIWDFLMTGIITLLHFVISGAGRPNKLNVILLCIAVTALFILLIFLSLPSLLWAPLMLIFGYSFVDAFIASTRLSGKATGKLFIGLLFPFAAVILIQYAVSFIPLPQFVFSIIAAALYVLLITYLIPFMMIAAFELTGLERRDVKKSFV